MNTAQDRARQVRRRYRFIHPSDIERVLRAQNIEVIRFPLVGRLEEIAVFDQLAIRDSIGGRRRNELLAHSLGHYLLHTGNQLLLTTPDGAGTANKWERQAWDFAFELLMPAESVEEYLRKGWSDSDLRDHFEVSDQFFQARMEAFRMGLTIRGEVPNPLATEEW